MTLTTAPAQSPSVFSSLPARHPLVSYFLIAFGFSWLMFLPGPLIYYGVISLSDDVVRLLAIAGLLGPILSGFIMTALTEGRPRHSALAPPNGVLARWDSMVRVRSRWAPSNHGACHFHPARCLGVVRHFRRAILLGLSACIHLYGSHRRTALRGTRLDRLRAASLAAIMWSFDRRPNPRQSVGSVAFAWIPNPLPGRDGYTSERYSPRLRRVRPGPNGSAPNHHLGRQ